MRSISARSLPSSAPIIWALFGLALTKALNNRALIITNAPNNWDQLKSLVCRGASAGRAEMGVHDLVHSIARIAGAEEQDGAPRRPCERALAAWEIVPDGEPHRPVFGTAPPRLSVFSFLDNPHRLHPEGSEG